jgi:hypothetical protein
MVEFQLLIFVLHFQMLNVLKHQQYKLAIKKKSKEIKDKMYKEYLMD